MDVRGCLDQREIDVQGEIVLTRVRAPVGSAKMCEYVSITLERLFRQLHWCDSHFQVPPFAAGFFRAGAWASIALSARRELSPEVAGTTAGSPPVALVGIEPGRVVRFVVFGFGRWPWRPVDLLIRPIGAKHLACTAETWVYGDGQAVTAIPCSALFTYVQYCTVVLR